MSKEDLGVSKDRLIKKGFREKFELDLVEVGGKYHFVNVTLKRGNKIVEELNKDHILWLEGLFDGMDIASEMAMVHWG